VTIVLECFQKRSLEIGGSPFVGAVGRDAELRPAGALVVRREVADVVVDGVLVDACAVDAEAGADADAGADAEADAGADAEAGAEGGAPTEAMVVWTTWLDVAAALADVASRAASARLPRSVSNATTPMTIAAHTPMRPSAIHAPRARCAFARCARMSNVGSSARRPN
jgi:hypothetical protein